MSAHNTKTRVRWGVIGSGGIARRRTIPEGILSAPHAELAAVYGRNAHSNKQAAETFHTHAAKSLDELLGCNIDAVYVASPPAVHAEQVMACARAGKHVLCEKPLGLSVSEVEAMINACAQAGVRLGTAFMMRFQSQHRAALEMIQQGKLGQLVFGRAQLSCWYPPIAGAWRQDPALGGGGSLMDMGGHCIDLLEMLFGPAKEVGCLIRNSVHGYASEDAAVVNVLFENGALGVVDSFFCIPDQASKNVLELYGSRGSILARNTIGQGAAGEMTAYLEGAATGYDAQQARASGNGQPIAPEPVNTYQAEIEEFSRAILEQREPLNHSRLGLQSQRVLAACYESARTHKFIAL